MFRARAAWRLPVQRGTSSTSRCPVPGAGVLDIEPSADDREGVAALGAFGLVAAAALAGSLAFFAGDSGGNGVFGTSLCDEVAQSDAWYLQCVSDVF